MKKKISQHDLKEIEMFKQYLKDKSTITREEFYRKYQDYMGLSNGELQLILKRKP